MKLLEKTSPSETSPSEISPAKHRLEIPSFSPRAPQFSLGARFVGRAEFIATDDARWRELLKRVPHDFYHLPEYVELSAAQEGGQATAFYAECGKARFLIPLLLRSLPRALNAPPEWRDAVNPYGYPCPLLLPENDGHQLDLFLQAFRETAHARNIISVFLRLHPLLPLPGEPLENHGKLVRHGQSIFIDLSTPEEEIMAGVCRNHRRDIKKLSADGFRVVMDDWSHYPRFIEIYRATMTRLNAHRMYFFEGDYFSRLREALGGNLHLATVLAPSGEIAGGEIFAATCGIVQNHLSGTAEEFVRSSPAKLLTHHIRCWAKEKGEKQFHMGGGLGGREDSLFRFKAGFSRQRADFLTFRMILDASKYEQLCALEKKVESEDDFFPAYRRCYNH